VVAWAIAVITEWLSANADGGSVIAKAMHPNDTLQIAFNATLLLREAFDPNVPVG
jgi:hypothetical protein